VNKNIPLNPVTSSNIKAMGHDVPSATMRVQFSNGGLYDYRNVDAAKYNSIISAESVGKAFISQVKSQAKLHPFEKVGG
jgi:hypothetical protein